MEQIALIEEQPRRKGGRPRKYASQAERQAAYLQRHDLQTITVQLSRATLDKLQAYYERQMRDGAALTQSQIIEKLIERQLCRKR